MTKTKSKTWLALFLSILLVIGGIWFLGRLTQPKYMSGVLEGAMTAEYYNEKNPHDVIFIGDCEVYENFSPVTMWRECGITSYIRGTAQQLIWQSYYLLEEAFRHESPKIVVYNVQAMKYDEPQSEAYNRMALDGMHLNASKLGAIRASMLPLGGDQRRRLGIPLPPQTRDGRRLPDACGRQAYEAASFGADSR